MGKRDELHHIAYKAAVNTAAKTNVDYKDYQQPKNGNSKTWIQLKAYLKDRNGYFRYLRQLGWTDSEIAWDLGYTEGIVNGVFKKDIEIDFLY